MYVRDLLIQNVLSQAAGVKWCLNINPCNVKGLLMLLVPLKMDNPLHCFSFYFVSPVYVV